MKFLLVAAKTGGHVFPASVIGEELTKNNHEVIFIGTGSEIEKNAYHNLDSRLYELSMEGFRGTNLIKKLPWVVIKDFKLEFANSFLYILKFIKWVISEL